MNDDNIKKSSDLSENGAVSAADRRFDVLENSDLGRSGNNSEANDAVMPDAGAFDDILGELDALAVQMTSPDAAGAPKAGTDAEAKKDGKEGAAPSKAQPRREKMADTGTIEFRRGTVLQPDEKAKKSAPPAQKSKKGYSAADVDKAAKTVSALVESGKLSSALDLVLCLRGAFRQEVREKANITIPLGSRDADLRRIAAGALIQSYLEQGKIVRRDIENKLYAIIESSEPEYDDDDEVIEQTDADVLYKVTACMTFAAELMERSGNHPDEKSAMYDSGDSVLDSFLADHIDEVYSTNKKRLAVLAEAMESSGGVVAEKFAAYYAEASRSGKSAISRFFGDSAAFKAAAAIIGVLCLVTLVLYVAIFPSSGINAQILGFVAKENGPIMLFAILAEIFALIGMTVLCVIVGFGGKSKKKR